MSNKVRYGLSKCTAFPIDTNKAGAIEYGTTIPLPGAVSITAEGVGDSSNFYADNGIYYSSSSNAGYSVELELALVPDEFLTECCGLQIDAAGAIVETTEPKKKKAFALAFQFEGDEAATRHIYYYCTASQPDIDGKTTEDSVEVATEKLTISASADADGNIKAKCLKANASYDTFFNAPYKVGAIS